MGAAERLWYGFPVPAQPIQRGPPSVVRQQALMQAKNEAVGLGAAGASSVARQQALMRRFGLGVVLALLLAGCLDAAQPDALAPQVLGQSASIRADNALIAEVEIRLSHPGRVFVEYENPQAGKFRTALSEERAKHLIPVLRLRAETAYSYAIWVQDADGAAHLAQRGAFTTGSLPSKLAAMRIRASGRSSQPLILTDYNPDFRNSYILLWDELGEIVWYYAHIPPRRCWKKAVHAIKPKRGGNLYYLGENCSITEITPLGEIVRQLMAGEEAGLPHHDFALLDDGRILYLSKEYPGEETAALASTLRIWDPERRRVQKVWDARDFWSAASATKAHLNSVSIGPRGNIILSSRHRHQVLSVAADFQRIEWQLGGPDSDYGFPNPNDRFYAQHEATQFPNGNILLFDNGDGRPAAEGGSYSRALEIRLDDERRSAVKAWEYRADPDIFSKVVSGTARLGNGNILINFGIRKELDLMPPTFMEVDRQGNALFRVETYLFLGNREGKGRPMRFRAAGGIGSILGETMLRPPSIPSSSPSSPRAEAFIPNDRQYWEAALRQGREQRLNAYRLLHESLVSGALGAPLARAAFDVHLNGNKLTYFKPSCAEEDTQAKFFLHVFPAEEVDLPPDRKPFGFNRLNFQFEWSGEFLDGGCIAQRLLPDYPLDRIQTGQFVPEGKQLWRAEFPAGALSR